MHTKYLSKPKEERPLERPFYRLNYNIEMDITDAICGRILIG
jgi:hypothetical protein